MSHMFNLEHLPDKNHSQVGANLFNQHTKQHARRLGYVTALIPGTHSAEVRLADVYDNHGKAVTIANVKVGTTRGGDGWGEFNLPWIGQLVEVVFESGMNTSGANASIGKRYYTKGQVPTHPLLSDRGHFKGYFFQSEGGSFKFEHADGQVTSYNISPSNQEGAKTNARDTGVNKTALESRMDKSAGNTAKASRALTDVSATSALIANSTAKLAMLTKLKARG